MPVERRDLAVEAPLRGPDVVEEVPDLNHDGLMPHRTQQCHVDGPASRGIRVEEKLRPCDPAALARRVDDELLTLEILVVSRPFSTRHSLEERHELQIER